MEDDPGETNDLLVNPTTENLKEAENLTKRLKELIKENARESDRCSKIFFVTL